MGSLTTFFFVNCRYKLIFMRDRAVRKHSASVCLLSINSLSMSKCCCFAIAGTFLSYWITWNEVNRMDEQRGTVVHSYQHCARPHYLQDCLHYLVVAVPRNPYAAYIWAIKYCTKAGWDLQVSVRGGVFFYTFFNMVNLYIYIYRKSTILPRSKIYLLH